MGTGLESRWSGEGADEMGSVEVWGGECGRGADLTKGGQGRLLIWYLWQHNLLSCLKEEIRRLILALKSSGISKNLRESRVRGKRGRGAY